jgi:hypothetical protein
MLLEERCVAIERRWERCRDFTALAIDRYKAGEAGTGAQRKRRRAQIFEGDVSEGGRRVLIDWESPPALQRAHVNDGGLFNPDVRLRQFPQFGLIQYFERGAWAIIVRSLFGT